MSQKGTSHSYLLLILGLAFIGLATWSYLYHSGDKSSIPPNQGTTDIKKYNRLGEEKSPYLVQHKNNPVNWFAWGKEAFQAAREENKLIFLSVGYSTCYWCHVMEKDSFERQEVADVLNKDYIAIKVDREERPDVDRIYMDAVQRLTGRGGWPMSVFLTPDLKPFFGGTFFRRPKFLKILADLQKEWQGNPDKILNSSEKLATNLQPENYSSFAPPLKDKTLKLAFRQLKQRFDEEFGGFGRAPKFPQSPRVSLLLRVYHRSGNKKALEMATETLNQMARGGMYDHLGGGFHRYSTDKKWFAPHFEKMLYDNAQLAVTYLEAYQVTQNPEYAQIAREILDYVLRDMTDPQGGFYSAQDAGEVGKEGEYYVWKEREIKEILTPQEFASFKKVYPIQPQGNFHKQENILHLKPETKWKEKDKSLLQSAQQKLLKRRQERTPPHLDDKILTAWNGLMIAAMAKGYRVLGDQKYLEAAQASAGFLEKFLVNEEGKLLRRWREGEARFPAYLNDYSYLIHGLLSLYEGDFDSKWLKWAIALQEQQDQLFWDEGTGGYFFSQLGDNSLINRKKISNDGAIPSGNSLAALNLLRLNDLILDEKYRERSQDQFRFLAGELKRYPAGYPQALIALDYLLDSAKEIAVVPGTNPELIDGLQKFLSKAFLPNKVLAIGPGVPFEDTQSQPGLLRAKSALQDKTTIYVCEDNICKEPSHELNKAKSQIQDQRKYKF